MKKTTSRLPPSISYLGLIGFFLAVVFLPLIIWGLSGKDHFAAIPMNGDKTYYRNWGDRVTREIQDRDVLYHNIGHSIKYARKADIIIIGHSMLLFGLRADLIEKFERKHGIKIYNLASAGDGSGEFLRRIIKRWGLKPQLWVINADDHAANFFNVSLDDFGASGKSSAINVVKYGRFTGYLHVAGRNLRWRMEDLMLAYLPTKLTKALFQEPIQVSWRSVKNGNFNLDQSPDYIRPNNGLIKLMRSKDCHTDLVEIERAKHYLANIGGHAILTLVPYHNFCAQRVYELAQALNTEAIIPPTVAYTTKDNGGHLDRRGAIAFTTFFLSALERTEAFKKLERVRKEKNN